MNTISSIEDIKKMLVGKTIVDVTSSYVGQLSILFTDGNIVDVGVGQHQIWLSDRRYDNITKFFDNIADYRIHHGIESEVTYSFDGNNVIIDAGDGHKFNLCINDLKSDKEKQIMSHQMAGNFIPHIVDSGAFWILAFKADYHPDDRIPSDLIIY